VDLIRSVQPGGPYWLAGWSMGGLLAFEVAGQLSRAGAAVCPVLLFDSHVTRIADQDMRLGYSDAELFVHVFWRSFRLQCDKATDLKEGAALSYVIGRAKEHGLVTPDYTLERAERQLAVVRQNIRAARMYTPLVYCGDVLLIRAKAESGVPYVEDAGWSRYVSGSLTVCHVDANHNDILRYPCVAAVAQQIKQVVRIHEGQSDRNTH